MKKPEDNITYGDEGGVDSVRKYHDVHSGGNDQKRRWNNGVGTESRCKASQGAHLLTPMHWKGTGSRVGAGEQDAPG